MSDVVVSVIESTTNVTVTEQDVAVAVTETSVDVSTSTAGIQGASYAKGDPIYEYVRNSTGATLLKGQIVYLSGATGNHVNVSLAQASGDSTSARTIGWVSEDILNNAQGYVMMFGYLEGIDTSGANAVGDILYLSPTVAGGWTSTKPYAPDHLVYVGVCVRKNPSNGAVSVHIQNGYELDEIHDVQITGLADGDLLRYESSTDLWKNKAASTLTLAQSQITNLVSDLAGKAALGSANAFTVGGHSITAEGTAIVPLVIKGAVNQSGNLQEWQNSGSTAIAKIDKNGAVSATYFGPSGVGLLGYLDWTASSPLFQTGGTAVVGIRVRGAVNQSANLQEWQSSAGATALYIGSSGAIRTTGSIKTTALDGVAATLAIQPAAASTIGAVIRGAASQSANLTEWQTSAGSTALYIDSSSRINSTTAANFNGFPAGLTYLGVYAANTVPAAIFRASSSGVQTGDTLQYQNSAGTILGGRNANSQIFTGSTTTIKTAVGGTIQSIATGANPLVTMASAHNLAVGDLVTLASTTSGTYDGTFVIATVPLTTTFTITSALTAGQAGAAGTVSVPAQASITARSAGTVGAIIRATANQNSNLTEWQNSSGTILARIESTGNLVVNSNTGAISSTTFILGSRNSGAEMTMVRQSAATTNPGANLARLYFRDGTTVGTLKLVVRAGAAGAETTILDNIPQ